MFFISTLPEGDTHFALIFFDIFNLTLDPNPLNALCKNGRCGLLSKSHVQEPKGDKTDGHQKPCRKGITPLKGEAA